MKIKHHFGYTMSIMFSGIFKFTHYVQKKRSGVVGRKEVAVITIFIAYSI